jgi:hypothetical protein
MHDPSAPKALQAIFVHWVWQAPEPAAGAPPPLAPPPLPIPKTPRIKAITPHNDRAIIKPIIAPVIILRAVASPSLSPAAVTQRIAPYKAIPSVRITIAVNAIVAKLPKNASSEPRQNPATSVGMSFSVLPTSDTNPAGAALCAKIIPIIFVFCLKI